MKKTILMATMVVSMAYLVSCGNDSEKGHDDSHAEIGLELNEGKKWIANSETTDGVNKMNEILNSFSEKDDVQAYGALTAELKTEFSLIFKNCTMSGEAHEQLHTFLVPIKDLLQTLDSSDLKECQDSYEGLNKQINEYKNFFE